jgi:hypothetical protein
MTIRFSMFNGEEEIECQISTVAIDQLVGGARGFSVDREAQFSHLRDTIESVASAKFDTAAVVDGGSVRIFAKDIAKAVRDDFGLTG